MIILIILALGNFDIDNRLPFPEGFVEQDYQWMCDDPNMAQSYFDCYQEIEGRPWLCLLAENWLEYNPVMVTQRGVVYYRKREHWSIGNVNGDDVVNLKDFAFYAKYFRR